jgi:type I restriction enzyme, R subunit
MGDQRKNEQAFESIIEHHLLAVGYCSLPPDQYNKEKAFFPHTTIGFIKSTQPSEWTKLEALLGEKTEAQVISDLTKWLDLNGSLDTLRHGFKCYGRLLQVAYFKAAHTLNPALEKKYASNYLGITRQLRYSQKSKENGRPGVIDITLSLNGLPVATIELKNPLTGQSAEDAKRQYKKDRDPRELLFEFKRRTIVHFAADTELIFMTTRLAGDATHFLPLNKGFNGGAGNPEDPQHRSYRTAYLWEEILEKHSFVDLIARFIHLQVEERLTDDGKKFRKETIIFPRYHQLQAVRALVQATITDGVGNNYLIEHSAGSGKSNTIAWLAHRLASLHYSNNLKVFDSVIVITDRLILDRQLQDTIYQFEHKKGVVAKIDEDSRQLAESLENAVPIIITTLQKFPFVTGHLIKMAEERGETGTGILPTRNLAVIIDEAHSSQSGEAATDLKEVLGGDQLVKKATQLAKEEGTEDLEALYRSMAKRGKQSNLSFFAFTATPKHRTLKVFGTNNEPFHKYTMRQAIEEGFIMDVLSNYTTYATYYKLIKAGETDPQVERRKAVKALARFLQLHPHNISQKTEVIIEHFNIATRHKIGGHAKAMVVTGSRLEAVRYKQSFDSYIKRKGYSIKSLVAFSGEVEDDKVQNLMYTEEKMNSGIRERELAERFATPEYHILLVAEKYQTGFDQPLLHTMYVDKRLGGIQAVQTLSRLNRTHPLKEDTFVLDFANDRNEIQQAFKAYYDGAQIGEEVDSAKLYHLQKELEMSGLFISEDIHRFCSIYLKPKQQQNAADHQALNVALDPAVSRFCLLLDEKEEEAELFRSKAKAFRNLYAFLSQIIPYQDSDLEKLFLFIRHLTQKLPRLTATPDYSFDDTVRLEYYRLQKISEGSISLNSGSRPLLDGPTNLGTGMVREDSIWLSKLVDLVNERFGTEFNQADQYFFDQIVETAVTTESIIEAATANPEDKFELVFKNLLQNLFIERIDQNEDIFLKFMNIPAFQKFITSSLASQAYHKIKASLIESPDLPPASS